MMLWKKSYILRTTHNVQQKSDIDPGEPIQSFTARSRDIVNVLLLPSFQTRDIVNVLVLLPARGEVALYILSCFSQGKSASASKKRKNRAGSVKFFSGRLLPYHFSFWMMFAPARLIRCSRHGCSELKRHHLILFIQQLRTELA